MKQYFCDELNNVLSCFHDRIMSCCSGIIGPVYIEGYRGERINWEAFKKVKEDAFKMFNEQDIDKTPCKNCFYLRERKETDVVSQKFNLINVSHWTHCNCGCIYCARMFYSKGQIIYKNGKSEYYDFLPLLKELYKHDLLDRENLHAVIQGGEISVLKEFEPIIKEFIKHGVKNFTILSNNLKYQPIIKKLLDKEMVQYITSLDCGCRETYKRLKRVDKFNDFVKNLKKYAKTKNINHIHVKYIVVEHINDNIEEITKYFDLMSNIGIKLVEFMIDNKYTLFTDLDKTPLPAHYKDLFFHFKNEAEKRNMNLILFQRTEDIAHKYFYNREL